MQDAEDSLPAGPPPAGHTTTRRRRQWPHVARVLVLGYLGVILLGTALLTLPVSNMQGAWTPVWVAFFTATSAVCVTGLIVVDTGTHFSYFGQTVIMLLIQIGGLGYATAYIFIVLLLGRKLSTGDQNILRTGLNLPHLGHLREVVVRVVIITLAVEALGMAIMLPAFLCHRGGGGVFDALFQAVSSFNNAGFSTFTDSLVSFAGNPAIGLTMPILTVLGGIGFIVMMDLHERFFLRRRRILSLHTHVVLRATALLLIVGFVLSLVFEWNNPATLAGDPLGVKLLKAFSMSVFPRTCGFNTVGYNVVTPSTYLLTLVLMFIGASPGGTGGGVKTTSFAVISLATLNSFRGRTATIIHGRKVPARVLINAYGLLTVWFAVLLVASVAIAHFEPFGTEDIVFETVSALGTVGLSRGITANLHWTSQGVLCLLMILGRVGPITAGSIAFHPAPPEVVHYPVEDVLVG
jgi:trk system potassium uptake protein TrkH